MAARDSGTTSRLLRRPGRRAAGFLVAFTACLCLALLSTAVWNAGKRSQQEQLLSTRATATWSPGPQGMVGTTSQTDVETLRSQGWALPGLAAQGYTIADIRQARVGGQPAVVLTLHDDRDTLTVVEQRGRVNADNPLDGVTGLPVSAEGMDASLVEGSGLWVDREQWRAVMVRPDAVYTVTSRTPPATMAQTISAIVAEDRGRVSLPAQNDQSFGATVADGLREIFG